MPRFTTDFERIEVPLAWDDGTRAALCVDSGTIQNTTRGQPLCEVELEHAQGNLERLFEVAIALAASVPLAIETRSKAQRGFALSQAKKSAPVRAESVLLARDMSAADALTAILRNCLRQVESNADGLRENDDVEWVHQMRIGTRRLKSIATS